MEMQIITTLRFYLKKKAGENVGSEEPLATAGRSVN